jgi:hypothetical protein
MKECVNSTRKIRVHISSNFILSISLLIMFDTLLLWPSLHCNIPQHFTTLHPTALHYTPLHFTTLYPTPLHYTSLHFTTLHPTSLHYTNQHFTSSHLHFTTLSFSFTHYSSTGDFLGTLKLQILTVRGGIKYSFRSLHCSILLWITAGCSHRITLCCRQP